jgi:hypothetical protein
MELLKRIHQAFTIGNSTALKSALNELEIENFNDDTNKKFFVSLMKQSMKSPLGIEASKIVIDRWEQMDIEGHQLSTPSYMMMQTEIDLEILQRMAEALEHWDYTNFVYSYIHWDGSPQVELALKRIDDIYGKQPELVYKVLLQQIEKQRKEQGVFNHAVKNYLVAKIEAISEYAPKPKWIINDFEGYIPDEMDDVLLPDFETQTLIGILPTPEDASRMIFEQFQFNPFIRQQLEALDKESSQTIPEEQKPKFIFKELPIIKPISPSKKTKTSKKSTKSVSEGESCPILSPSQLRTLEEHQEDIISTLAITYNNANLQGKLELLGGLAPKISNDVLGKDITLFKLYGPSNPIVGQIIDDEDVKNSPCCKFGGCRMLTCNEFSKDDEFGDLEDEDNRDEEWFTGVCDKCHRKIAKKIYALRRPLTFGDWKGTYCSFKCLRDDVPLNDIHNHYVIDLVESQLLSIGIQNRVVSEKEGQINDEELEKRLRGEIKDDIQQKETQVMIQELKTNPLRKYDM